MSLPRPISEAALDTAPAPSGPSTSSTLQQDRPQNSLPAVNQPKGGGAIRGIGEKFSVSGPTGTATASIPFATSPGRMGFGPDITLSYDSGSGNSQFGFGWQLNLPSIIRKTDKGLPQYHDEENSDVFIFSEVEDLVPVLQRGVDDRWCLAKPLERKVGADVFIVSEYKPRIEGLFSRIERWTKLCNKETHWRIITSENVTSLYGETSESRISDPAHPGHIFGWLLSQKYDDKGNVICYEYKAENAEGVDLSQAHEQYRPDASRTVAKYPKSIKYGNRRPKHWDRPLENMQWMFELIFDYGEHDRDSPTTAPCDEWNVRPDPYSIYRAGFEIRTYRRCERILMFHHFPEEPDIGRDYLVSSLDLTYNADSESGFRNTHIASLLTSATRRSYIRDCFGHYSSQCLPPVEFRYSEAEISREVKDLECGALENLPYGADGTSYSWLDLNSEGLPGILSQQAGAYFYKPNLGNGKLGPTEALPLSPPVSTDKKERQEWLDLAGDGRLDLVQFGNPIPGFYKRNWDADGRWDVHREFCSLPNLSWTNPSLRLVDVTGDGLADVLIVEDDIFTYFPSRGEAGFGEGEYTRSSLNEDSGPRLLFSDGIETVYLADMSGDGLSDLLRVRNGEVCYWPNLGYGRFGSKVLMDNSPWFDLIDAFQQKRICFADVDGSGTTDLIYLHENQPLVFLNQAGNSWSSAYPVHAFPKYTNGVNVQVIDLLGRGTGSLVWSSILAGDSGRQIRYVDLMAKGKPYLLTSMKNNFGSEIHIEYLSSTQSYLEDKAAGRPWLTALPFPVQVVHRVNTIDRISGNRLTSRYKYHDGFFDPFEREYRGFGMVETWDCEEFEVAQRLRSQKSTTNYDPAFQSPPVLTKRWYDTGAYLRGLPIARQYESQYYEEPEVFANTLPWTVAPQDIRCGNDYIPYELSQVDIREAYRSLKGLLLREEIYGVDGTTFESQPYHVTASNFKIDLLQPRGPNKYAIFLTHPRETVQYYYERNRKMDSPDLKVDPRVSHQLNLTTDAFGNVLSSVSITYGRRSGCTSQHLESRDYSKQQRAAVLLDIHLYTNEIMEPNAHRLPLPYDSQQYELISFPVRSGPWLSSFAEAYAICENLDLHPRDIPFEQGTDCITSDRVCRRMLSRTKTKYRRNDLRGPLPFGRMESRALKYETYQQVLTPGLLKELYIETGKLKSASLCSTMRDRGGYVQLAPDPNYWKPSGQVFFSPRTHDSPEEEASFASNHFYLPYRFRDPLFSPSFDTEISICYDKYDLLVLQSRDAMNNLTTVGARDRSTKATIQSPGYDYRVLKPTLVMDANRNRTAYSYDVLGVLSASAVMGKPEETKGDLLNGFEPFLTERQKAAYLENPLEVGPSVLGDASIRYIDDYLAYYRTRSTRDPLPPTVASITRETHVADLAPGERSRLQHVFEYGDGFGRVIQTKKEAEPCVGSKKTRWNASGWTIFNNKGDPVKKYEPLFTETHRYQTTIIEGVGTLLLYDPMHRVVAVLNPDHTWSKVVHSAWFEQIWDNSDTVLRDAASDVDVGGYFKRLDPQDYKPSWYNSRIHGQLGKQEQIAAQKSSVFAATPTTSHYDPLGRTIVTVSHNKRHLDSEKAVDEFYYSRNDYDIVGNVRRSYDALGRMVENARYDMLQTTVHKTSMEAGSTWTLYSVLSQPVISWDSRGFETAMFYDRSERPIETFIRQGDGEQKLVSRTIYGEIEEEPTIPNVRDRVISHQDQAGIKRTNLYDFKGNLLNSSQQMAKQFSSIVDWSPGVAPLEDEIYASESRYDALNRLVCSTEPDRSTIRRQYNLSNQLQRLDIDLQGTSGWKTIITNAEYNAKGQRVLYEYGNGSKTLRFYDSLTFVLRRIVSSRGDARSSESRCSQQGHLQDFSYTYDATRNITHVHNGAQQNIFFRNQVVEPDNVYTYDAIGRLVEASGREHLGQNESAEPYGRQDSCENSIDQPNDPKAMGRYTECYSYDAAGNILELRHRSHAPSQKSWTRRYCYSEPSTLETDKLSNRLSSTHVGAREDTFLYEGNEGLTGNITSMTGFSILKWDFRNQLQATATQKSRGTPETTWSTYADGGQRTRKLTQRYADAVCEPTRKQERLYIGDLELLRKYVADGKEILNESHTLNISDGGERIVMIEMVTKGEKNRPPIVTRYQLGDHLGSALLELSEFAEIITYEEYYPYGSSSYMATRSTMEAPRKRYRYSGQERDSESGLYYHGLRYYVPWLGRWLNPDPLSVAADGPNLYQFVRSNPIKFKDPTGGGPEQLEPLFEEGAEIAERWGEAAMRSALVTGALAAAGAALDSAYQGVKEWWSGNPHPVTTPAPAPAPPVDIPSPPPPPLAPPTSKEKAPPIPVPVTPKAPPKPVPKPKETPKPPPKKEPPKEKPKEKSDDDTTDLGRELLWQAFKTIAKILVKIIAEKKGWNDPQWHHTIPQRYRAKFLAKGIDVDAPENGRIIPKWMHEAISRKEDAEWMDWMAKNTDSKGNITASRKAILAFRDDQERRFMTNWLYHPPNTYRQHQRDRGAAVRAHVAKYGYFRPPPP